MSCVHPDPFPNGYRFIDPDIEMSLQFADLPDSVLNNIRCEDGYNGTPNVMSCTSSGGEYMLDGCERSCPPLLDRTNPDGSPNPDYRNIDQIFEDRSDIIIKRQRVKDWIQDFLDWRVQEGHCVPEFGIWEKDSSGNDIKPGNSLWDHDNPRLPVATGWCEKNFQATGVCDTDGCIQGGRARFCNCIENGPVFTGGDENIYTPDSWNVSPRLVGHYRAGSIIYDKEAPWGRIVTNSRKPWELLAQHDQVVTGSDLPSWFNDKINFGYDSNQIIDIDDNDKISPPEIVTSETPAAAIPRIFRERIGWNLGGTDLTSRLRSEITGDSYEANQTKCDLVTGYLRAATGDQEITCFYPHDNEDQCSTPGTTHYTPDPNNEKSKYLTDKCSKYGTNETACTSAHCNYYNTATIENSEPVLFKADIQMAIDRGEYNPFTSDAETFLQNGGLEKISINDIIAYLEHKGKNPYGPPYNISSSLQVQEDYQFQDIINLITLNCEQDNEDDYCSLDGQSLFDPNYTYPNQDFLDWNDTSSHPLNTFMVQTCTGDDDGTGSSATCTGDDDGTGEPCALNPEGNGCAVQDGDCVFTAATSGNACALNDDGLGCAVQGGDCQVGQQLLDHSELTYIYKKERYNRYLDKLYEHMETEVWGDDAIDSTTGHPEDIGHGDGITPNANNKDFVTSLRETNYNFDEHFIKSDSNNPDGIRNRHYYFKSGDFGLKWTGFTNNYHHDDNNINQILGNESNNHIYDGYIKDYINMVNPKFTNYEGVDYGTSVDEDYRTNLQITAADPPIQIKPKHNRELKKCKPFIKYTSRNDHLEGTAAENGIHEEIEKTKYLGVVNSFISDEGPRSPTSEINFLYQKDFWKSIAEKYGITLGDEETMHSVTNIPDNIPDSGSYSTANQLDNTKRKLLKKTEYYLKKIGEVSKPSISGFYYEPINLHNFITIDTGRFVSDDLTYDFITNYFHHLKEEDDNELGGDTEAQNYLLRNRDIQINKSLYERVSPFSVSQQDLNEQVSFSLAAVPGRHDAMATNKIPQERDLCNLESELAYGTWLNDTTADTHARAEHVPLAQQFGARASYGLRPSYGFMSEGVNTCQPIGDILSPIKFGSDEFTTNNTIRDGYQRAHHMVSTGSYGRIFPIDFKDENSDAENETSKLEPLYLMSEITRRNILKLRPTKDKDKYFIRWNSWFNPKAGMESDTYRPEPNSHFGGMEDRLDRNTNRVQLRSFRKHISGMHEAFWDPEMYQGVHFTIVKGLRPHDYASINIRSGAGGGSNRHIPKSHPAVNRNIRYYFNQGRNEELLGYVNPTNIPSGGTVLNNSRRHDFPTSPHTDEQIGERLAVQNSGYVGEVTDRIQERLTNYYNYFNQKRDRGEEVEDFFYDLPARAEGHIISRVAGGGDVQSIQDEGVSFNYGCYIDIDEIDEYVTELAEDFVGQTTEEAAAYDDQQNAGENAGMITFNYPLVQGNCNKKQSSRNTTVEAKPSSYSFMKNNATTWGLNMSETDKTCSDVLAERTNTNDPRAEEEAAAGIDHEVIKLPLTATENLQRAKNSFKKVLLGFTNSIDIDVVNRYIQADLDATSSDLSIEDKKQINLHKAPYRLGSIFTSGEVANDWISKADAWMAQNPCDGNSWGEEDGECLLPEDGFDKYKKYNVNSDEIPSYLTNYQNNYNIFIEQNINTDQCSCNLHQIIINGSCQDCPDHQINNSPPIRTSVTNQTEGTCSELVCPPNTYFNPSNAHQCTECLPTEQSPGTIIWTADSCSDDTYQDQDSCEEAGSTWTAGSCSDDTYQDQESCINNVNECQSFTCQADHYSDNHICVHCPPGTTNEAGTVGGIGTCEVISCENDEYVNNNTCYNCPPITGDISVDNYSTTSPVRNATDDNTFCDIPSSLVLSEMNLILHKCDNNEEDSIQTIKNSQSCNSHQSCIQNINECYYDNYSIELSNAHFKRYYSDRDYSVKLCNDILGRKYTESDYGSLACSYEINEHGDQITENNSEFNKDSEPNIENTNSILLNSDDCRVGYSLTDQNSHCQINKYNREYINIEPFMYENNTYTIRDHYKPIKQEITLDGEQVTIEYVDLRTLPQRSNSNFGYLSDLTGYRYPEIITSDYPYLTDESIERILNEQNILLTGSDTGTVLRDDLGEQWPSDLTHNGTLLYFIDSRDGAIHCPHPLLTGDPDTSNTGGDTTKYFFDKNDDNYTCKPRTTTCESGNIPTDNSIADNFDNRCGSWTVNCTYDDDSTNIQGIVDEDDRSIIRFSIPEESNVFPTIDIDVNSLSYIYNTAEETCYLSNGTCPENQYRVCPDNQDGSTNITLGNQCTGTYQEPVNTWTPGSCSDGISQDQATCEAATHTWTAESCSDPTSTDQATCEAATHTWTAGSCSDSTFTDQATCEEATHTWTAESCSDSTSTDQATCEAATHTWTAGSCSDPTSTDQATCEAATHTWDPNVGGNCSDPNLDEDSCLTVQTTISCPLDTDEVTCTRLGCTFSSGQETCSIPIQCMTCTLDELPDNIRQHAYTGETVNNYVQNKDDFIICNNNPVEGVTSNFDTPQNGSFLPDACADGFYLSSSGTCESIICNPGTSPQNATLDTENISLDYGSGFNYQFNCNDNFEGTITSTCGGNQVDSSGNVNIDYQGSCNSIICTQPSDITGYTIISENLDLTSTQGFDVNIQCAVGYEGTPSVTACTTSGPYSVSGCQEITCTRPSDTTGYVITDDDESILTHNGFSVTPQCAVGYEGTPSATACTTSGEYTLDGCTEITCTRPSDTAGYDITDESILTQNGFNVSARCASASGYEGTPSATSCTTSGEYSLTGCTPIECTRPTDTSGYIITSENLDLSTGSFSVSASCDSSNDFVGRAEATSCTTSGPYTLSGCVQDFTCVRPSDITGYTITSENLDTNSTDGFSVSGNCADGFTGTLTAIQCTEDGGEYTLTGCSQEVEQSCAATCTETATTSVQADADACAAVTNLTDSEECRNVMTAADSSISACTYTASMGSPTCSLPSCGAPNADGTCPTGCILGMGGTWTAESCSDGTSTDQASCEAATHTWTAESCSDGTSTDQATCEAATHTWTAGSCSDPTSTDQSTCEAATHTWTAGSCSDGTSTDQATCEAATHTWTAGSCSDPTSTDQSTCEAATHTWTAGSCSDGTSTDQATCEGSGSSCTVNPSLSCTLTSDGECPTGCIFSCEAPSAEETASLGECTSLLGSEIISNDVSLKVGTHLEHNLELGDLFNVELRCKDTHIGLPRITPCSEPGTPYTIDSNYCIPRNDPSVSLEEDPATEDYTLEIQSEVVFAGDPPPEGSAEEAEFKENFINALLTQLPELNNDPSKITIDGIRAGSTIVDYTISYPVNEGETPPSQEALQTVIQQADFTTLGYGAPTSVTVTRQAAPTRGYLFLGISFMVCLSVIALIVILMMKKKSE